MVHDNNQNKERSGKIMASATAGLQNQQAEAIRFLIAKISNLGLDQAWATAKTAAAQTKVLAAWKFQTTDSVVQQMAANQQVKQALTSYLPNAAATKFATDLRSDQNLAQGWATALQANVSGSGTVDDQALNAFLTGRGYDCTYQQVGAALCQLQRTNIAWWAGQYTTVVVTGAKSASQAGPSVSIADAGTVRINGIAVQTPRMRNGIFRCGSESATPPGLPAATLMMTLATPVSGSKTGSVCGFSGIVQMTAGASAKVAGKMTPPAGPDDGGTAGGSVGSYILEGLNWLWNQFIGLVEGQILMSLVKLLFRGLASVYDWIVQSSVKSVLDSTRPALEALQKALQKPKADTSSEDEGEGNDSDADEGASDSSASSDAGTASDTGTAASDTSTAASDAGNAASDAGNAASDAGTAASDAGAAADAAADVSTGAEVLADLGEAAEFLPLLLL